MSGSLRVLPAWPQQDIFRLNCSHRRGGDFERVYPLIRPLAWEKEGLPADAGASPACETLVGSALACVQVGVGFRIPSSMPALRSVLDLAERHCDSTLKSTCPPPPAATGFCSFSSGFASCLHTPTNNFPGRKEGRKEAHRIEVSSKLQTTPQSGSHFTGSLHGAVRKYARMLGRRVEVLGDLQAQPEKP